MKREDTLSLSNLNSMERDSVHTSLVIEVEDREEPEQKTYMIDFDIQEISKDYVVDQVFCGENVTVYALFEVPEGSKKKHENMLEISNSNSRDNYELDERISSKTLTNEKRLNGYKPSLPLMKSSDSMKIHPKQPESGSLYCLQSLSRTYGVMTPERKPSDFEILYNKRANVPKSVKSKFKAVSKGVNTDVVQSPKIMHEVEQAVKFNLSNLKKHETASCKPSCEVIELEMHQSFSSFSSSGDSKRRFVKPSPNFFLVPLLVVDDGLLSHFQVKGKANVPAEKLKTSSLGTATDFPELSTVAPKLETKNKEKAVEELTPPAETPKPPSGEPTEVDEKKENNKNIIRKGKVNVLKEIRKLQLKLNALTKLLESSDNEYEIDSSESETAGIEESVVTEPELPREKKRQKHDDLPIFSSMMYSSNPAYKRKGPKKKRSETPEEKKKNEVLTPVKSSSLGLISLDTIHSKPRVIGENLKSNMKLRKASISSGINRFDLENRKGVGLSKSEICNYVTVFDIKVNVLKKCFSCFIKGERGEAFMLKRIKNSYLKLEGSPKSKSSKRITQKEETHLQSTMGDEAMQKTKNSKDLLNLSIIKPSENMSELNSKKNLNVEEGDAKLVYSKQSLVSHTVSVEPEKLEGHFNSNENCTTTVVSENLLLTDGSSNPSETLKLPSVVIEPVIDTVLDVEKVPLDVEKLAPPKKTPVKKEVKTTLKKSNPVKDRSKTSEKFPKMEKKEFSMQEPMKQKLLLTNRKNGGRANANSKLHIDKLIRQEPKNSSKTTSGTDEKFGLKGASRPCSRRRDLVPETVADECKEKEGKTSKVVSENSLRGKKVEVSHPEDDEPVTLYKKQETSGDFSSDAESNLPTFSSPSVVLEVFSEKPNTPEDSSLTLDKQIIVENNEVVVRTEGITLEVEKPVLKSVWALTKVLIFEDGTKKVEVLEASMNPPDNSVTVKKSDPEN